MFGCLVAALPAQRQVLAAGTPFATEAFTIDSGNPGPTVMVVAGVHGDEPGSVAAAEQIAGWTLRRGRLVVLPRADTRAVQSGRPTAPGAEAEADLDRLFGSAPPKSPLAGELWALLQRTHPDVLLVLREGAEGKPAKEQPRNGAVLATAAARQLAEQLCVALQPELAAAGRAFRCSGPPPDASLALAAQTDLGVTALALAPATRDQPPPVRARQHRLLVAAVLQQHDMLAHGPHVLLGTATKAAPKAVRVALFTDSGAAGAGPGRLRALLAPAEGFLLRDVCGADVRDGVLSQFDLAIFPGGSGSGLGKSLATDGRQRVRDFLASGGGYLGFCAGAYLAANNYDWSLHILDAKVIDREHWKRGRAPVAVAWAEAARRLQAPGRTTDVLYANGPILAPAEDADLQDFETLAVFRGEVAMNNAPRGVMPGTPAIVRGHFGKGTVICSSPHPEQTKGLEDFVRALARSAAGR